MLRVGPALAASAFLVVACSGKERPPYVPSGDPALEIPYERLPEPAATFEEQDCDVELDDYAVQCGFVTVPEAPGSERQMKLAVMRIFSNAKEVASDPVIYLNGGPGGPSLGDAEFYVSTFEPLLEVRDLILFDQRGTGDSRPELSCTETQDDLEEALDGCFERLSSKTDLSATDSVSNARDVDGVRASFGYEQWNLFGISYGTRLGLTVARDYPAGVRSLIVDSVVPLEIDLIAGIGQNGQNAFELAFSACLADAECAEKYPDSIGQLRTTAAQWDAEPAGDLELGGKDLVNVLFSLAYSPRGIEILPFLVDEVAAGKLAGLERVLGQIGTGSDAFGMHLSLHCAEEVPFTDEAIVAGADESIFPELREGLSGRTYFEYCAHWPVEKAPGSENSAVVSAIPSLVLSGEFDPVTPPANAAMVHASLSNSQYFNLENESHGASVGECGLSLVQAFLDAPNEIVPSTCLGDVPDLEFRSIAPSSAVHTIEGKLRFVTVAPSADRLDAIVRDAVARRR